MKRGALAAAAVVLLNIACICFYRYYKVTWLPEKNVDDAYIGQLELFERIKPESSDDDPKTKASDKASKNLAKAQEINSSIVGWITIPETNIDYPIVQGDDNDFYLHNGFDGKYNYDVGCPFLDYRCDGDLSGFNSIVYAHNMIDRRMFADVSLFKDSGFMSEVPCGALTTHDSIHNIRFFAYLNVPSTSPLYHAVFITDSERDDYLDYIFSEALYTQGVSREDIGADAHLLLLSTCTFEYDDARGVVVGIIE